MPLVTCRLAHCLLISSLVSFYTSQTSLCQEESRLPYGNMGQDALITQMERLIPFVKKYRNSHEHLPYSPDEQDEFLQYLHVRSRNYDPNQPIPMPVQQGTYRCLGQYCIDCDQSINEESNILKWRSVAPNWSNHAGQICVMSDGGENFLVWPVGADGFVMRTANGGALFRLIDCQTDTDELL